MRLFAITFAVLSTFYTADASACGPRSAPVALFEVGGEFLFVANHTFVRVRPPGTVVLTKELEFVSEALLMPDGVHLLNVVGFDSGDSCWPRRYRLELIDTRRSGRARVLGAFPRRASGAAGFRLARRDTDGIVLDVSSMSPDGESERWERVVVSGTRARATRMEAPPIPPETEEPRPLLKLMDTLGPLSAHAAGWNDGNHRIEIKRGANTLATIRLTSAAEAARFSQDGRHLAVSTYEGQGDYQTGYDPRLDVIDLVTGAVVTAHGATTGVSQVTGRVTMQCEHVVNDSDSDLNVRVRPAPTARVAGALPHGTVVQLGERRGRWSQVLGPVAGWAWAESIENRCQLP